MSRRGARWLVAGLVILVAAYVAIIVLTLPDSPGTVIRYDRLATDIVGGKVEQATVLAADRRIAAIDDGQKVWTSYVSEISSTYTSLITALQQGSVPIHIDDQYVKALLRGPAVTFIFPVLILGDIILLGYLLSQGSLFRFRKSGSREVTSGERKVTFADVAGVDEAVVELDEIREFLSDPLRFTALGARIPRGVLLVGPPGCGKTLLARALAGEGDARFFAISGSAFVEMYVGVGAARIRDLFREAQEAAPAIVFIDELDAVGRGRVSEALSDQAERESTLNQLLVSLDGFHQESGVVVVAATNRPDILDAALLRPGRFDRQVMVDLPNVAGRRQILEVHTRDKPVAGDVVLDEVARRTPGFSGADLASVVNEAALLTARAGATEITRPVLSEAVERVVAGPQRRARMLSEREKESVAYHEAGHAVVSVALTPEDSVSKVSIVSRGPAAGLTWFLAPDERTVLTRGDLMARIARLLGGLAADELVTGEVTTGSERDIERATDLARRMAGELGMSARVGPVSLKPPTYRYDAGMPSAPSPELAALVDEEMRAILTEAKEMARRAIAERRPLLDRLARKLIEVETLEGPELEQLLYDGPPRIAVEPASA